MANNNPADNKKKKVLLAFSGGLSLHRELKGLLHNIRE